MTSIANYTRPSDCLFLASRLLH